MTKVTLGLPYYCYREQGRGYVPHLLTVPPFAIVGTYPTCPIAVSAVTEHIRHSSFAFAYIASNAVFITPMALWHVNPHCDG